MKATGIDRESLRQVANAEASSGHAVASTPAFRLPPPNRRLPRLNHVAR
jgi:hypothetical protein